MKKILLILIFLNFVGIYAQEDSENKIQKVNKSELKFEDLENSDDIFSFRFWNKGQIIEIRILSDSTRIGTIVNFVTKAYKSSKKQDKILSGKIDEKAFFQKIELSDNRISETIKLIKNSKITELPSDNEIMNWKPILDGEWYSFEQKIDGKYEMKNYGNPRQQYELPEGVKFLNFYSALNDILDLEKKFAYFFADLKNGCYSKNGEHTIICKTRK